MKTPVDSAEEARVRALRQYAILDTLPEDVYNDLALAAATLCGTPYALIGFVDQERVWYKAQIGLPFVELPREVAICSHAVLQTKPLVISDLCHDKRFVQNPLLQSPHSIRFYAAAPLITPEGYLIGVLSVLDSRPRRLNRGTLMVLQTLAMSVVNRLEHDRKAAELKRLLVEWEWVEDARRIENSILNAVVEGTSDAILVKDTQGRFLKVNPSAASLLGRPQEEILGRDVRAFFPEQEARNLIQSDLEVLRSGQTRMVEEIITVRGSPRVFQTTKSLCRDENGRILGVVDISRDITDRRKAEESLERQLRRLAALRSIEMAINASLDLRITLEILLDQAVAQLEVEAADILLINTYTQTLELAARRGVCVWEKRIDSCRLGEGFAGRAALEHRIVSVPDLDRGAEGDPSPRLRAGAIGYFAVPLIARNHIRGVLQIYYRGPREFDAEWYNFLETLTEQAAIAIENAALFEDLQRTNLELTLAYDATIEGWAHALDLRDQETEGHSRRVTDLTLRLAQEIGMSKHELMHVRRGALLHDIGKMAIPDRILFKPGPLNEEEWQIMKRHPVYAYEMLSKIDYLRPALDIPYCHHEKWDGSGYPRGLRGEQIPLAARIFALADVWDALLSDRPYRKGWPEEKVRAYIRSEVGKHFDPEIAQLFLRMRLEPVSIS